MAWLIVAFLVIVSLKFLAALLQTRSRRQESRAYSSAGNLLTPAEQKFWMTLRDALPPGVMACPKVRLIDVLTPDSGDHGARQRVLRKHLDFVLMDALSSRIIGAIELDDSSHLRKDRQERDRFVDDAMQYAGVPLLRIPCARNYDKAEIARQLNDMVGTRSSRGVVSKAVKSLVENR